MVFQSSNPKGIKEPLFTSDPEIAAIVLGGGGRAKLLGRRFLWGLLSVFGSVPWQSRILFSILAAGVFQNTSVISRERCCFILSP
jgi:hypothetical protein